MLTFSSNYDRKAFDAEGHPLAEHDRVTPLSYRGAPGEAPVYRIRCVCTDASTLILSRADGSTLYRQAAEVRYLAD